MKKGPRTGVALVDFTRQDVLLFRSKGFKKIGKAFVKSADGVQIAVVPQGPCSL